jgi:hypothetical protein
MERGGGRVRMRIECVGCACEKAYPHKCMCHVYVCMSCTQLCLCVHESG